MSFLRSRAILIIIAVMALLCIVTIGITIDISMSIARRQNQAEKTEVEKLNQSSENTISLDATTLKLGRLHEQTFYYNGEKLDSSAFVSDKNGIFLPIDSILNKIGIKFKYYGSDDLMEFVMDGKKITLRLGISSFKIGKTSVDISSIPITEGNHLLVPLEILTYFKDFRAEINLEKASVFLNYYPTSNTKINSIKILRVVNGKTHITDMNGEIIYWTSKNLSDSRELLTPSSKGEQFLLSSGEQLYIISANKYKTPVPITANLFSSWSADDKSLFWTNKAENTLFAYDIFKRKTFNLGSIIPKSNNSDSYLRSFKMYTYYKDSLYNIVSLVNSKSNNVYTYVKQLGSVIIEGKSLYSPDKKAILFKLDGKKYFVAASDGSKPQFIGSASEAYWASNDKILLISGDNMTLVSKDGTSKTRIEIPWRYIGQAADDGVFITKGDSLYLQTKNISKKITALPYSLDYIFAEKSTGPYFGVSVSKNSLLYIRRDKVLKIGSYSSLLKEVDNVDLLNCYTANIVTSHNGKDIAILSKENGLLSINRLSVDDGEMKQKNIVLNCPVNGESFSDLISAKWASNSLLIVSSPTSIWRIDFNNNIKVYKTTEHQGSIIKGIIN